MYYMCNYVYTAGSGRHNSNGAQTDGMEPDYYEEDDGEQDTCLSESLHFLYLIT